MTEKVNNEHGVLCECCKIRRELIDLFSKNELSPKEAINEMAKLVMDIMEHEQIDGISASNECFVLEVSKKHKIKLEPEEDTNKMQKH